MSYTGVKKILEDKDESEIKEYEELVPMFELMQELAAILREKRENVAPLTLISRKQRLFWIKRDIL